MANSLLITRKRLRRLNVCWEDERLAAHVPLEGLAPLQMLNEDASVEDRLWVLLCPTLISNRDLRLLACKWAREALALIDHPDQRSVHAIEVAERYARGKANRKDLGVAAEYALCAIGDVISAEPAAVLAACVAADCVRQSARDAAKTAANHALRTIARANRDAPWFVGLMAIVEAGKQQIEDVRCVLQKS